MINVAAAVIEKDNKFLVAKRKAGKHLGGKWEFPGGKIEAGETAQDCLRRELAEEFGIVAEVTDFVGESMFDYGDRVVRLLGYRAKYGGGEFQLRDHDEIKWVSSAELNEIDFAEADIPLVRIIIRTA